MRDKVQRAGWALLAALETMHAAGSKRPDWLLSFWRLYYRRGWPDEPGMDTARTKSTTERDGRERGVA